MRNLAFYSVYLLLVLSGCVGASDKPVIKGGADAEIINLTDSTVRLYTSPTPITILKGEDPTVDFSIAVDSNGIFMQSYDFPEGYYTFAYDQEQRQFFIQKDKKLSFDLNAKTPMATPEFSGKLKYESRYLWQKFLTIADFEASLINYISTSPGNYMAALDYYKSKLDTALVVYITNHPTGSTYFMQQESLHNYYFMAKYITMYQAHLQSQSFADATIDSLAGTYLPRINDSNALDLTIYYDFIAQSQLNAVGVATELAHVHTHLQWIDSIFTFAEAQDYLMAQTLQQVVYWPQSASKTHAIDTLLFSLNDADITNHLRAEVMRDTIMTDSLQNTMP